MINDLNLKGKPLGENLVIGFINDFLDVTLKAKSIKGKFNFIEIKNFCAF